MQNCVTVEATCEGPSNCFYRTKTFFLQSMALMILTVFVFFSPGIIAVIVFLSIASVVPVSVGIYCHKSRHRSYGQLLDNNERNILDNFPNPAYDHRTADSLSDC
uniref:Uncharacterized protein n=1 Tax=Gasterosteus aculeatus aculeatus TaxID=481459 RepID=A0AAQ4QEU8_GASAC